jgi:hypothetical protein
MHVNCDAFDAALMVVLFLFGVVTGAGFAWFEMVKHEKTDKPPGS